METRKHPDKALWIAVGGIVLGAVSLALPWWTADVSGSGLGGFRDSGSASPFDPGTGFVRDDDATTTASLMIVGLLLSLVGVAAPFALKTRPAWAPWALLGGATLLLVAVIHAPVAWPSGDMGFWDSAGAAGVSIRTSADLGWYVALIGAADLVVAGVMAVARPRTAAAA